jgi:pilus assembly protein Flp/PilA
MFGSSAQGLRVRLPGPPMAKAILRRFRRDERGVTAIEFGMVATPFIALLFAIIETALALWATQVLDTGVTNASRRVYTGQFQQGNIKDKDNKAELARKFKEEVCNNVKALLNCAKMTIDVREAGAFGGAPPQSPLTDGAIDPAKFGTYEHPGANRVVVVRVAVEYPVFVSLLNPNQANLSNGNRLLMASTAFRTEPFAP